MKDPVTGENVTLVQLGVLRLLRSGKRIAVAVAHGSPVARINGEDVNWKTVGSMFNRGMVRRVDPEHNRTGMHWMELTEQWKIRAGAARPHVAQREERGINGPGWAIGSKGWRKSRGGV